MEKPHGKDAVVQAIIQAAIPLIAEGGVKAVTFRDVAKNANVNHGLITRHFGTKDELVHQVSDHLVQLFFEAAKQSRPEFLTPLWQVVRGNRVAGKAFARIIQETTPALDRQQANRSTLGEVVEWLRGNVQIEAEADASVTNLAIYLLAVLFFGGETFGSHLQLALGLSEEDLLSLQEKAFQLVFDGLSQALKNPTRTRSV